MVLPKGFLHALSLTVIPAPIARVAAQAIVLTAPMTIIPLHPVVPITRITTIPQPHTMVVLPINH